MLAIGAQGKQACVTTSIRWKLSAEADPFVKLPAEQVRTWIDLYKALQSIHNMPLNLKESWNKALSKVRFPKLN